MSFTDIARGAYARAPLWTRAAAGALLAAFPSGLLNGSAYSSLRRDISRASTDADFCRSERRRLLRETLLRASGAPGYAKQLGGIDLEKADPLDTLAHLPVLDRAAVARDPSAYLCSPASTMDMVTTGGTGGTPLSFFLDRDRSPREWAFVTSIWSRAGYSPGDRRAVLRGVDFGGRGRTWFWDPALRELALSPFDLTDEVMSRYLGLLTTYRIQWLHGYPSAVSALCSYAARAGWQPPVALAGVLLISEPVYAHQLELIHKVLPSREVLPFYGQSERVSIAGETPGEPGTYEFEPLYGISELVDDHGHPVTVAGARGRLLGTGFISKGMPLLRYDTGDTAELVELSSPSNGHRLTVRAIWGRWRQEFLVGREGNPISMTALNIHSSAYCGVRQFQFFQDTPGVAVLRVVPITGRDAAGGESLRREFAAKVAHVLELRLEVVDTLQPTIRGKRVFIDQRLGVPGTSDPSGNS